LDEEYIMPGRPGHREISRRPDLPIIDRIRNSYNQRINSIKISITHLKIAYLLTYHTNITRFLILGDVGIILDTCAGRTSPQGVRKIDNSLSISALEPILLAASECWQALSPETRYLTSGFLTRSRPDSWSGRFSQKR
jgi:hypothetical protein